MEAIKVRLRADVPLGIYLSGGIDSSAVAGMVAHLVKEEGARLGNDESHLLSRIKCFTVQFDKDSGADESGTNLAMLIPNIGTLSITRYCTAYRRMARG
jgi:asparagine synthase (glutamine-hydrolysing)